MISSVRSGERRGRLGHPRARGTRALRRGRGEQPDHPSCSLRRHDQNVLPRCAQ